MKKCVGMMIMIITMSVLLLSCESKESAKPPDSGVQKLIQEMMDARAEQRQIEYPSKTYGAMTIEEAYEIQDQLGKSLNNTVGSMIGYKVAYASKAAQEQFGVKEPATGAFFDLQRVPNGSTLPAATFIEIVLETEIAFTIGKRIDKAIASVEEIKDYVKWVHTAFDAGNYGVVHGETKPTPQDMIATGVGAHVFVLGPAVDPNSINIDALTLKVIRNGEIITASAATNVMGSPWNALLWCANHIVKQGKTLEPGMVIVSGTAAAAYKVQGEEIKGDYLGDCGALGQVRMTLK
jgi:2-keto-4-pentenoate hydratase